jgi:hypothetical protein
MNRIRMSLLAAAVASTAALSGATAQAPLPSSPPPSAPPAPSPFKFSGVIFGNWQDHMDSATKAANSGRSFNKFDIERVYLTFVMAAGDRATIRATTDIVQSTAGGYYGGWTVRLKYAWLQYDLNRSKDANAWSAFAKLGMLATPVIDYEENYWPRWIAQTAADRNGLFPSSDVGVGAQLTLPNRLGVLYGTLTNGSGYSNVETDRFKDAALRLSFTPWGKRKSGLSTLSFSPWVWKGAKGSKFAAGGAGQVAPVTAGLDRNRWGILAAVKDPRWTAAAEYARRIDGSEAGSNTIASPDVITSTTGDLLDGYVITRPGAWSHADTPAPFALLLRYDKVRLNTTTSANNSFLTVGAFYDLTARTAISLDYQMQTPHDGSTTPGTKVVYMHWVANF